MNRFKFWRWGRLRKLGKPLYITLFTAAWTVFNVGLGIYREMNVLNWSWSEVFAFQSQIILFVVGSGALIGWFTWDIGDDELKVGLDSHVLDTERLILRKMSQVDFKVECRILMDKRTMSMYSGPYTKDEIRMWMLKSMESYARNGFGRYLVVKKSDGAVIGDVGLLLKDVNGQKEVELGYVIHADHWGHGYATEAARACLEYGYNELKIQRIVVQVPTDHVIAEQVALKIGMRKTVSFLNTKNMSRHMNLYVYE